MRGPSVSGGPFHLHHMSDAVVIAGQKRPGETRRVFENKANFFTAALHQKKGRSSATSVVLHRSNVS